MRRSVLLIACLCAGWSASPALAVFLYGVSYDGDIYKINQSTGTREVFIPDTGVQWLDAADGRELNKFFATAQDGSLYLINVDTKAFAPPIGSYGAGVLIKTLAYAEPATPGGTGVLYGSDYTNLYTINMDTGAAGPAVAIHGAGDFFIGVWSMDYDPAAGRLYITNQFGNSSKLYYVDPGTGLATLVGQIKEDPTSDDVPINDMWYDHDSGRMLAMGYGEAQLFEINTGTGQLTKIGTPLIGSEKCIDIMGLGSPLPEPTAGLLFLLAAALPGLVIRRRR